ncbi:hypothetical protein C1I98_28530 [Spongiactinospora gelatinilytica]|uniref:Uncharacterized protein n=1 Tax=Spongiactinospora gelatinilytica TaxID=2666298 RepID=A0A2W2GHJ9_9ACTN|nr:hypothetical protein C1I98_28530 [Spongiactinospora gelatinilytica]
MGERVRALREAAGLRQEDLSRAARAAGLAWPRSKIAQLERGDKALSAEELLLLPVVLGWVLDRPVPWRELVDGDIALSDQVTIAAADLSRYMALPLAELLAVRASDPGEVWERIRGRCAELGIPAQPPAFAEVLAASGEAEYRAATRLKESGEVYAAISAHLWGRTMSAERDDLAEESGAAAAGLTAHRGRAARTLDEEVQAFIRKE